MGVVPPGHSVWMDGNTQLSREPRAIALAGPIPAPGLGYRINENVHPSPDSIPNKMYERGTLMRLRNEDLRGRDTTSDSTVLLESARVVRVPLTLKREV